MEPEQAKIWIVDDEPGVAELISQHLRREGFAPEVLADPRVAVVEAESHPPGLILLDILMPGMSGIDVCKRLKEGEKTRAIPVIFLTGQGDESMVVTGLELGADDYLTKPFSLKLLTARIRAVLRRYNSDEGERLEYESGPIHLDLNSHDVKVNGEAVSLTLAEFHVLVALLREPGRVLTRKTLLHCIARDDKPLIERNVDVHIGTLRKKLGEAGRSLVTVRGVGYRLRV